MFRIKLNNFKIKMETIILNKREYTTNEFKKKYIEEYHSLNIYPLVGIYEREAGLLNLDCSKSNKILKWKNILSFNETINMTAAWYHFYLKKINMQKITMSQIKSYEIILNKRFER